MNGFKIPTHTPQDLILIHDLIAVTSVPGSRELALPIPADGSIDDNENGSEEEIEADLIASEEDERVIISPKQTVAIPSDSDLDSDSDSDSDPDVRSVTIDKKDPNSKDEEQDADDEDELGPVVTTRSYFPTKNEIIEADHAIPDIDEVGPEEELEKVGEIMSIIDNTVIVKGLASAVANRGSGKALDSDTLLVFDDRKVVGYIFETFGPTTQPFYQVKFSQRYPLDTEKVRVSRQVFHVPQRSNFVFLSQIRSVKGSDASNVHDEEPADDEVEFSDDEQEAAHKSLKRKRGESKAHSVASSRHATPVIQDFDFANSRFLGTTPYDEHGLYDIDFVEGPSRPPPIPYDDPYSDNYDVEITNTEARVAEGSASLGQRTSSPSFMREGGRGRRTGGVRGRGEGKEGRQSAGRGQARGRGRGDRGRSRGDRGRNHRQSRDESNLGWSEQPAASMPPYDPHTARPLSPTSLAIARATGQYSGGVNFDNPPICDPLASGPPLQQFYQQPQYQQQYVQPHINPRFASAFGLNMDFIQPSSHPYYPQYGLNHETSNWADEWTVHTNPRG